MRPVSYTQPTGVSPAIAMVARDGDAQFLAGGTNLVDLMKIDVAVPAHLVDVTGLASHDPRLARIEELGDGTLRIGSLVSNSDLAYHAAVRSRFPVLSEALLSGATVQLRNMATVGGNLLQRTRCYYFRDTASPCNKRQPGSGCSATGGYNRMHAILGGSDQCIAVNPSDMCVALTALDAVVRVRGPGGDRTIPLPDFHRLPGEHPEQDSVLDHGDFILGVDIPPLPFATRSHYLKVRDRSSYAFALASAAVALDVQDNVIRGARLALGGVGTKPWRARPAEVTLTGRPPGPAAYHDAAEIALRDAVPQRFNAFKIELAKRTIVRALTTAGSMT
jgi:xanthine dehydrogenase YagS FAD-binding subunit